MNATTFSHRCIDRGFSLIEVLIAVVVLSFGLLALAALQSRLIQSSSDAKAQTVALALAKDKLEEMRGYGCLVDMPTCGNSYADLSTGSDVVAASGGATGGVDFTRSWTVTHYVLPAAGGAFCVGGATGCAGAAAPNTGYKTVSIRVAWTDASNQSRVIALEDAIAGLDPADSARNQRNRGGRSRGPRVIIVDPSTEAGVIPIAVGDGSETAATNPKPVNVARTGDDAIETRFDVLTYAALTGTNNALAQSRVETTVVGCTCTKTAASAKGYRPTYWDGYRYVPPQLASANAPARASTSVTQSRYCTACCRDHHDIGASAPKFSPRRLTHTHYRLSTAVPPQLVVAGPDEDYLEACRLIRVDGIFNVAADLSNDYYNLLPTANQFSSYQPSEADPNAVASYQDFVLSYLGSRYVTPNPSVGQESGAYNNRSLPSPSASAGSTLDTVGPVDINPNSAAPIADRIKWLHSRGLYIDYLEKPALDRIGDAKANCVRPPSIPTADQLRDCVLKVLPFTSINLTEIASWTPLANGSQIKVTNDDFSTSGTLGTPIRGKVEAGTSPVNGRETPAVSLVGSSNSGVAISGNINPDEDQDISVDVNGSRTDSQLFRIAGGSGGQSGATFNFQTTGYTISTSNPRSLGFTYGATDIVCGVSGTLNPVECGTQPGQPLPAVLTVRVGNYNTKSTVSRTNPCHSNSSQMADMPYVTDYDVASISTSGSGSVESPLRVISSGGVGAIGSGGEYTEALVSPVGPGDTITAAMSQPVYKCPASSAYTCENGNKVVWSPIVTAYASGYCTGTFP